MAYRRNRTASNTTVVVGEKRAARRSRRGYGKRKGGIGIKITPEWVGGFVAAFCIPQNPVIDGVAMMTATAPVRGLGQARGVAMGYTCGQAAQHILLPMVGVTVPDFLANALTGARVNGSSNVVN